MFLKQYNYKPRSNSQSSASGEAAKQEALVQETAAQAQQDNAGASTGTSGRRRVSQHYLSSRNTNSANIMICSPQPTPNSQA